SRHRPHQHRAPRVPRSRDRQPRPYRRQGLAPRHPRRTYAQRRPPAHKRPSRQKVPTTCITKMRHDSSVLVSLQDIMDSPPSASALASERRVGFFPTVGGKWFALAVLFSMNLLNYVDRYAFFAVGPQVQEHLRISNLRLGVLNSAFMIVYTL